MGVTPFMLFLHQAAQAPEVTYEADKGSMWTLLLTNLGRYLGLTRPPTSLTSQEPGLWGARGGARLEGQQGPAVTRVCLCADGHLLEPDAEYVHWLV